MNHSVARALALALAAPPASRMPRRPVPMAGKPEEVGLSSAQLKRLEAVDQAEHRRRADARRRHAGGAARQDRVGVGAGQARPGADDPMKFDSIFRIYSMTKPIVSLALMQLVEEGRLQVSDPVAKYLPEIGKMKVGTEVTGVDGRPTLRLSDPSAPMTVQDLLRHTAGLTYGNRGTSLVHKAYVDAKIGDRTPPTRRWCSRLSKLPLLFTPGDRWEYSVSVDVQGRLIEVLTGKKLGEAFAERVLRAARHGRHRLPGAGRTSSRAPRSPDRSPTARR